MVIINSIFQTVSSKFSALNKSIYSKASMLAISHALEDLVINFQLEAELFVTFQKFKFFLMEKERYLELDKICRKVFVFAQEIEESHTREFQNTVFIDIDSTSSMADEWSVIINHPQHPIILTTTEQYELALFQEDDLRYFKGFLSFDPQVIQTAVKGIVNQLKPKGIVFSPYPVRNISLTPYEKEVNNKLTLFVNQLINKIEIKVTNLVDKNTLLRDSLRKNKEISLEMVRRLCYAAEYRDDDTGNHLTRISNYAAKLYSLIENNPQNIEYIRYASMMHDIGKIGIPDAILLKPGKLTTSEFELIKTHTTIGNYILQGSTLPLINMGCEIAHYHHERWDGSGYPQGLKGKEIPLFARVVAIVDVFDALRSRRSYKEAFPLEKCIHIIEQDLNKHFDGEIGELFLQNIDLFLEIDEKDPR